AERAGERHEIPDSAEVYVRRVVPIVIEEMRHRHPPGQKNMEPDLPMTEIRERNDGAPADAHEVLDDDARIARRLQRLAQHHVIERLRRVGREIAVGVTLDHREAVAHTGVDAGLRQLDAATVYVLGARQVGQELALAATDIEYARARLDEIRHHREVAA